MRKFRLSYLLVLLLLTAALTIPAAAAFSDTSGHWAESAIEKWSGQYQVLNGYPDGTFLPDHPITRGEFASLLDRFLSYQSASPAGTFPDVSGKWCESSVLKLNAAGVMLGSDGKSMYNANITREQAVTMLARAFEITGVSTETTWADADQLSNYAKSPVAAMTARGYIQDRSNGLFRPKEAITRAEVVDILNQMVTTLIQIPGTYRDSVEGNLMINAAGAVTLESMTVYGDLIVAPGVSADVTLSNSAVLGSIRNQSSVQVQQGTPVVIPPVVEPTVPEDESGKYTGQTLVYENQTVKILSAVPKYSLDNGQFYWGAQERLNYGGSDCTTRFGIDVSAYQNRNSPNNTIDWQAVAGDGVDFAMIRAGLRGTGSGTIFEDSFYAQNIDGAMGAGLDTGVYFFSQAISVEEAIEEADFVINLLRDHPINGPVAFDWEMKDSSYRVFGTTSEMATACAKAFCQRIEAAGYDAMVYFSKYVGYLKFDLSQLTDYGFWYPEYKYTTSSTNYPSMYYQMDIWQYTDRVTVAGIGGRVDANLQFLGK